MSKLKTLLTDLITLKRIAEKILSTPGEQLSSKEMSKINRFVIEALNSINDSVNEVKSTISDPWILAYLDQEVRDTADTILNARAHVYTQHKTIPAKETGNMLRRLLGRSKSSSPVYPKYNDQTPPKSRADTPTMYSTEDTISSNSSLASPVTLTPRRTPSPTASSSQSNPSP